MAKAAFFNGNSWLTFVNTAEGYGNSYFGIGEGVPFEYEYDFTLFSIYLNYSNVAFLGYLTQEGIDDSTAVIQTGFTDGAPNFSPSVGTTYNVKIGRNATEMYIKIDDVVMNINNNPDFFNVAIPYTGIDTIGNWGRAWSLVFGGERPFFGLLSNLKFTIDNEVVLDMPLTDDLLDHSDYEHPMTMHGNVQLIEDDYFSLAQGSQTSGADDAIHIQGDAFGGDLFAVDSVPVLDSNINVVGKVSAMGVDKATCAFRYVLASIIPQGSIIEAAQISLNDNDLGLPSENALARIRLELAAAPAEYTDLTDYLARPKTTGYLEFDVVQVHDQRRLLDITSLLQEVVNEYSVSAVAVYFDDENEEGADNNIYCFYNADGEGPQGGGVPYRSKIFVAYKEEAEAEGYHVIYDANGGTGTLIDDNSPYDEDDTVTVLANTFTREGYTFLKWNTKADGSGTDYAPADMFTISADTTLYAQWGAGTGTIAGNQSFMHYFRHMGRSCR